MKNNYMDDRDLIRKKIFVPRRFHMIIFIRIAGAEHKCPGHSEQRCVAACIRHVMKDCSLVVDRSPPIGTGHSQQTIWQDESPRARRHGNRKSTIVVLFHDTSGILNTHRRGKNAGQLFSSLLIDV